jgi:hypothetical protein
MPRYGAAWTVAAVGVAGATSCRPCASLMGAAAGGGRVVQISLWNPTTTACQYRICRITTAGTQGADMVENVYSVDSPAASCTPRDSHTATDCTVTANAFDVVGLGAAVGSGAILTFGGLTNGLVIDKATSSGIGIVPVGTGQLILVGFIWDE